MDKKRVLVIATSKESEGGIVAVVNAHAAAGFWKNWECRWIPTHSTKSRWISLKLFVSAFFKFLWFLPSYQIIHLHLSHPVSFLRKCFFFFPAYLARKVIIIHFHAASPEVTIHGRLAALYAFVFRRAHKVIAISESWAEMIRQRVPGVKISLVYNPATPYSTIKSALLPERRDPYILFAGSLIARKGYNDLIRAFQGVLKKYPYWKLVMAGHGETDKGLALAKELGIENAVEFPGWVSGEKKEEIFSNASIFCLPTYAEGFPMAILDAMSYSIPVVTTGVGGILDAFTPGRDLLIFTPGDTAELEKKLECLISNAALRKELSANAERIIREKFSIKAVSEKMDAIYQSTI